MLHEYKFKDLEAAADAMVDQIVHQLRTQIARSGNAVLAVGGGRTPKHVLPRLAARDCDWRRVTVYNLWAILDTDFMALVSCVIAFWFGNRTFGKRRT